MQFYQTLAKTLEAQLEWAVANFLPARRRPTEGTHKRHVPSINNYPTPDRHDWARLALQARRNGDAGTHSRQFMFGINFRSGR
ncbi:hypothetical protein [Rhizobium sp. BR 314]|uniref:hypothetical protein n=1 Tax=Rhizobium sp. BR 314 TaxID=3040013 RepID=UPI0039BFCDC3